MDYIYVCTLFYEFQYIFLRRGL